MKAWAHRVCTIAKRAKWYTQSAYACLEMSLQLDWKYLQRTFHGVGTLMVPINEALREAFFPAIFVVEEVSLELRKILGHSFKHGGLGIPDLCLSEEHAYSTSKSASEVLLGSLLRGKYLNYVAHKGCVRRASADRWKHWEFSDKLELNRRKELVDRTGLNLFRRATYNGGWVTAIPR